MSLAQCTFCKNTYVLIKYMREAVCGAQGLGECYGDKRESRKKEGNHQGPRTRQCG